MTTQEISAESKEDSFYDYMTSLSHDTVNAVTDRISVISNKVWSIHTEVCEKLWYTNLNKCILYSIAAQAGALLILSLVLSSQSQLQKDLAEIFEKSTKRCDALCDAAIKNINKIADTAIKNINKIADTAIKSLNEKADAAINNL